MTEYGRLRAEHDDEVGYDEIMEYRAKGLQEQRLVQTVAGYENLLRYSSGYGLIDKRAKEVAKTLGVAIRSHKDRAGCRMYTVCQMAEQA